MNSDIERRIFEACGWVYDTAQRAWLAQDGSGYRVTTDDLMVAADVVGKDMERHLKRVAWRHRKR